ncbi:MAG: magnesium-translocating P-type ATPase [Dysgonamonadaceae bacterium]|jgi:Mg2+-importing ATPase|nr:magnesium-translocating P-type ATPase [Dysgonamonadaceae bacterium]
MKSYFFKLVHKNLQSQVGTEQEKRIAQDLKSSALKNPEQVIQDLNSNPQGLTEEEADNRLNSYGRNVVVHDKPKPWYLQLLMAFNNPFNYVLFVLALVSVLTGDYTGMTIIVIMVLLSVVIKFTQEYKSGKSAEALKAMVHTNCTVTRISETGKSENKEIYIEELVPGDIIQLAAGDIIPADVRIIHSKNLYISQSALTGESLPVEKGDVATDTDNVLDIKNLCFMGTNVDIGSATAIVLSTGANTYFGSMAKALTTTTTQQTSFDIGVNKVSWLLIRFMLIMVPVVFFISGFTKGDWLQALMFALSVAVGLTPEMLPVVVTTNLAKGAVRMSKEKVVVKKLNAIQNFGAMNVLCTDKTGTLTQDKIIVVKHLDISMQDSAEVFRLACFNSYFQSGLKNQMDIAILEDKDAQICKEAAVSWKSLDEIPYDFIRRRMSVVLQQTGGMPMIITKGAVDEMLSCTAFVNTPSGEVPLNEELKAEIQKNVASLNEDGLRVLAVAHRIFDKDHSNIYTVEDESDLVLDGFVAFLDPPKETAKKALDSLKENGIKVMVLTGDNDVIAGKVCREVGLEFDRIITGSELDNLSDSEASELIEQHQIFARLTPMQKGRIVNLLRQNGHVVGYMGDGINDAVSLRNADIGISVDTAVDIAKESADLILLEKSLLVLNQGVTEGRKTFANTMKYIKVTASSNFGNVFSLIGASAMFPFLPMLPIQILILNLLYDLSQISIPWDNVDKEFLAKPRKWVATDIKRFMIFIGPSSSIFDYATFGLMWFIICPMAFGGLGYHALSAQQQLIFAGIFQTGWFIESLFTQTLVMQVLRTEKVPFFQSRPSLIVFSTAMLLLIVGVALPYTALGKAIGFVALPLHFYYWLVAILFCYIMLAQILKKWYIKKYNSWL